MSLSTILTSLHGRVIGVSKTGDVLVNKGTDVVDGILKPQSRARVSLSAAQVDGAFTTPVELVAAPGAGFVNIVDRVIVSKAAGTAFGGIAIGEDIQIEYGTANVAVVTDIETTGFLDQTALEQRIARAVDPTGGLDLQGYANDNIEFTLLVGDITGGSALVVEVWYERFELAALTV